MRVVGLPQGLPAPQWWGTQGLPQACAVFLETPECELDAAQADKAHDLAWSKLRSLTCRGGAKWKGARALPGRTGEDGVAAAFAHKVSGVVLSHFAAI